MDISLYENRASTIGNSCTGSYEVVAGRRLTLIFGIAAVAFTIAAADLIGPAIRQVRGVLVIHRAEDEEVPFLIDANRSSILGLTAATMGGLCLVRVIAMMVADVAASRTEKREQVRLGNQVIERRQAAEALDESNRLLQEARVLLKKTHEEQEY